MATCRHWSVSLRLRRCPTLSNPVLWQSWMAAYPGSTLQMKMLFLGWPIMVHDTHMRRRSISVMLHNHWMTTSCSFHRVQFFIKNFVILVFVTICLRTKKTKTIFKCHIRVNVLLCDADVQSVWYTVLYWTFCILQWQFFYWSFSVTTVLCCCVFLEQEWQYTMRREMQVHLDTFATEIS